MKWSLSRVRLAGIGPVDARFDPLDLVLTDPEGEHVLDTVFWLINGGGKTLLLRLLFWVLRPDIVTQVGAEDAQAGGRHRVTHIGAYLGSGDTGHVVTEWRLTEGDRIVSPTRLVLGILASPRPGRSTAELANIRRLWYSIRADDGALGADGLAFAVDGRRLPHPEYRETLDRIGRTAPARGKRPLVRTFDGREEWLRHLDDLGMDGAIFRHQVKMNRGEASANNLLSFNSDRQFIEWFIDAITDPDELTRVDTALARVSDKIRRLPETERELAFVSAVSACLEPLGAAVDGIGRADTARADAERAAIALRDAMAAAHAAADAANRASTERAAGESGRFRDLERRIGTVEAETRELRLHGASIRRDDLARERERLAGALGTAKLDRDAWRLVERIARIDQIDGELGVAREALAAADRDEAPLRRRRDEAAVALRTRLLAEGVVQRGIELGEKDRSRDLRERATRTQKEASDADGEARERRTRREILAREADVAGNRRDAAVRAGHIRAGETARTARERIEADIAAGDARAEAIGVRAAEITDETAQREATEAADGVLLADADHELRGLRDQVAAAERDRGRIAGMAAVRDVAGGEDVDLDLVGTTVADKLAERRATAARRRIETAIRAEGDRRAVEALEADALLPPPLDVADALAVLERAAIPAAAGMHYLARSGDPDRREQVMRRVPALAAGVVLTGDTPVADAVAALAVAGLDRTTVLSVATTEALVAHEADDGVAGDPAVLLPSPAAYDPLAAADERDRREARVRDWDTAEADAAAEADEAGRALEALSRYLDAWGAGVLAERIARRDDLATRTGDLRERIRLSREAREGLRREARRLDQEAGELARSQRRLTEVRGILDRVVEDEDAAAARAAEIDRLKAEEKEWSEAAQAFRDDAQKTSTAADTAFEAGAAARTAAMRAEEAAAAIVTTAPIPLPDPAAAARLRDGEPLATLESRYAALERELRAKTTESPAAMRVGALERDRGVEAEALSAAPEAAVERARVLAASPEAVDAERVRVAIETADHTLDEATRAEAAAGVALERAEGEVAEARRVIEDARQPRIDLPRPDDRFAADRAIAAKGAERAALVVDRDAAEAAAKAAAAEADAASARSILLRGQVDTLEGRFRGREIPAPAPAAPFASDADPVSAVRDAGHAIDEAVTEQEAAGRAWTAAASTLRATLAEDRYLELARSPLGRRVAMLGTEPIAVARTAEDVRTTEGRLRAEIDELRTHRGLLVRELADATDRALRELRAAESRSRMAETLHEWAHQPFLKIRFERPATPDELMARLTAFVADIASRPPDKRPAGAALLREACERAIVGEFRVEMLKPNDAYALRYVPIAETADMSNGQRATAAMCLLMMIAALRAKNRAKGVPGPGVLLLDNPFGNASADYLLGVQRTVAAALGVQLVYTTGVKDYDAIAPFRNVIALANDQAKGRHLRYVHPHPELLGVLSVRDPDAGHLSAVRVLERDQRDGHRPEA